MTQTILNGGTRTQQDAYTGPKNELSVDESDGNLRLADGATPGGRHFLNRDNSDNRYQLASAELSGFNEFEPQDRGLLVRLGPGDYILRAISGAATSITVTNGNGYGGNPTVALASVVSSNHEWSGNHTASGDWSFTGGLTGDLTGDVMGNTTGTHIGPVTGDLTGDSQGHHIGQMTGDVDVRGAQFLVDDGQIEPEAINGLEAFVKTNGVPAGVILMWSGAASAIPDGWFLCDGTNGTPDLRGRFVVGAGGTYTVGQDGGAAAVTPTITVASNGAHTHSLSGNTASAVTSISVTKPTVGVENEQSQTNVVNNVTLSDPGHVHAQGGTADSAGAHTHDATSSEIDNRPPFFALCYIMKGA